MICRVVAVDVGNAATKQCIPSLTGRAVLGLGLPLRQPSRFVRIDSRSLTAAHRPARIRAAITSMLRGCRVGVARPHYRPRVAVFSHLQPGDPAALRSVLCSPFIALLLLVWPSASFAQPQFVNGLRIPGADSRCQR